MNYLFLTYDAVKELASIHQLQSSDFDDGLELCNILKGNINQWSKYKIHFKKNAKDGGFFFSSIPDPRQGILFDLTTFNGFKLNDDQIITIFQKVLKFTIRYFENLPPAACEKHINGSDLALVFPFPFLASKDTYRVFIQKNADSKRNSRRNRKYLLVFREGYEVQEKELSYTLLNKAIEEADVICKPLNLDIQNKISDTQVRVDALKLTQLDNSMDLSISSGLGLENWQEYLTSSQKSFVFKKIKGPERLEGAAGTGKTLTMILRCINLLQEHNNQNSSYHILFVTHSISTKNQIIEVFKSNLPEFETYMDKSYSSTSITITTLHEWCINILGGLIGSTEYLDRDAQDSKILQRLHLEVALNKAIEDDYPTFKQFCSDRFVDFFEKTEKEYLLEMLEHEIGVTIKGRANGVLDTYKKLPRLKYSIPAKDEDLAFIYIIYKYYDNGLKIVDQYDTDDIVISACPLPLRCNQRKVEFLMLNFKVHRA